MDYAEKVMTIVWSCFTSSRVAISIAGKPG